MTLVNLKTLASFKIEISLSLSECVSKKESKGIHEIKSTKKRPFNTYFLAMNLASKISVYEISSTIVVRKLKSTSNANNESMTHIITLYSISLKLGGLKATCTGVKKTAKIDRKMMITSHLVLNFPLPDIMNLSLLIGHSNFIKMP
jgi:hypothetical protein